MAHFRLSKRCLNTKPWNRSDKLYLDWFTKREAFIGKAVQTSTFLQEKIAKTAIERPDLPCIKTHEKNYSYSEINDWANQRALFFRSSFYHFQVRNRPLRTEFRPSVHQSTSVHIFIFLMVRRLNPSLR